MKKSLFLLQGKITLSKRAIGALGAMAKLFLLLLYPKLSNLLKTDVRKYNRDKSPNESVLKGSQKKLSLAI
jgi:hypothetical protein